MSVALTIRGNAIVCLVFEVIFAAVQQGEQGTPVRLS